MTNRIGVSKLWVVSKNDKTSTQYLQKKRQKWNLLMIVMREISAGQAVILSRADCYLMWIFGSVELALVAFQGC